MPSSSLEVRPEQRHIDIDIPAPREYESTADEELDAALVDAIEAADAAGNEHLAALLSLELGSHYYGTR